jgi:hypothetical protein
MAMPRYLIALGLLVFVIVAMGLISVVGDSWVWSAATGISIVIWLGLAAVVPKRAHRDKDTPQH